MARGLCACSEWVADSDLVGSHCEFLWDDFVGKISSRWQTARLRSTLHTYTYVYMHTYDGSQRSQERTRLVWCHGLFGQEWHWSNRSRYMEKVTRRSNFDDIQVHMHISTNTCMQMMIVAAICFNISGVFRDGFRHDLHFAFKKSSSVVRCERRRVMCICMYA